ncbi:hypothetical protein [Phaeodactylibacter luteus]|uniref:Lipoprotein n=1 Tax=Phaeodactylibacter luteus TaxID=1564516 RepID=A0A5C6RWG1_9BACT|nr:hypothetical protein [Phaeodactylibacter luteus]TXB66563.1 hypothetical protein FRY97_05085 [Phaeodactylibacter luteus]
MNIQISTLVAALAFFAFSCVQPPDYPEEPVIEYIGFNTLTFPQGGAGTPSDTLILTFGFTDGDGNLGFDDSTVDVFLTDSRTGFVDVKKLPVIPSEGVGNGISGEVTLRFPNQPSQICCLYPDQSTGCQPNPNYPTDTFSFEIQIQDRDGNRSNIIRTETVTLLCQ